MDKLDDVIENMTFLYIMSKGVDYSAHPIKKVDMLKMLIKKKLIIIVQIYILNMFQEVYIQLYYMNGLKMIKIFLKFIQKYTQKKQV